MRTRENLGVLPQVWCPLPINAGAETHCNRRSKTHTLYLQRLRAALICRNYEFLDDSWIWRRASTRSRSCVSSSADELRKPRTPVACRRERGVLIRTLEVASRLTRLKDCRV